MTNWTGGHWKLSSRFSGNTKCFLPQRREEVIGLKNELKASDSFGPEEVKKPDS